MSSIPSLGNGSGALQIARTSINRALAGLTRDATTVAQSTDAGSLAEITAALLDSKQQQLYAAAGARLMSTADSMMGALLNIKA